MNQINHSPITDHQYPSQAKVDLAGCRLGKATLGCFRAGQKGEKQGSERLGLASCKVGPTFAHTPRHIIAPSHRPFFHQQRKMSRSATLLLCALSFKYPFLMPRETKSAVAFHVTRLCPLPGHGYGVGER